MSALHRSFFLSLICLCAGGLTQSTANQFRWDFSSPDDNDAVAWRGDVGLSEGEISNGTLNLRITAASSYTKARQVDFDASDFRYLFVRMSADSMTSGSIGTYFGTDSEEVLNNEASIFVPVTLETEMQTFAIDLSQCPKWQGNIRSLRLDFIFAVGTTLKIAEIYLASSPGMEAYGSWTQRSEKGQPKFSMESPEPNAGRALAIGFDGRGTSKGTWSLIYNSCLPLGTYTISAECKNEPTFDVRGRNILSILFFDDEGNKISAPQIETVSEKTEEWTNLKASFSVPENATDVRVDLAAESSAGKSWWRNFQVAKAETDVSAAQDASWKAAWIRHPNGPLDNRTTYFWKEFDLDEEVLEARVQVTADDGFALFVNEQPVHSYNVHDGWMNIQTVEITPFLKSGRNTIGISNVNQYGHDGVILEGKVHLHSGKTLDLVTDASWITSDAEEPDWKMLGATNPGWVPSVVIGVPPVPPWGRMPFDEFPLLSHVEALAGALPPQVASGDTIPVPLSFLVKRNAGKLDKATLQFFRQNLCEAEVPIQLPSGLESTGKGEVSLRVPTEGIAPGRYELRLAIERARTVPEGGRLGEVEIIAGDNQPSATTSEVKPLNGAPMLHVNGKPVFTSFYYCAYNTDRTLKFFVRDFTEAGFDYFLLNVLYPLGRGASSSWWIGPGEYDFSMADEPVKRLLAVNPKAKILLSLGVDAPAWWAAKHPGELVQYEGEAPSYISSPTSQLWRKESGEAFQKMIEHVESSDYANSIIGYRAVGHDSGGEWQYMGGWEGKTADFSDAMTAYFRNWLKEKYQGQVEGLRAAWKSSDVTFETAGVPSRADREVADLIIFRDPQTSRPSMDYLECHNDAIANAVLHFAAISKQAAPDKVFATYGGYSLAYDGFQLLHNGQLSYQKVYNSKDVDILSGPSEYRFRDPGQPSGFHSPVDSAKLHGKLWMTESDLRTFLSGADNWNKVKDLRQAIGSLKREFTIGLTEGVGNYWFDMVGGWYANKGMMDSLGRMKVIGDKSLGQPRTFQPEIAVFVDTHSNYYLRSDPSALMRVVNSDIRHALGYIGAPYSLYSTDDILNADLPKYKLYLFLNAFGPTPEVRQAIKSRIQKDDNTLLWLYAPGFFRGNEYSIENMTDLTGIEMGWDRSAGPVAVAIGDVRDPRVEGLEGAVLGGQELGPVFFSEDTKAKVLGRLTTNDKPGLVVKDMGSWTSIFSATPNLSEKLLRNIARSAGVHIFSEDGDAIYTDGTFLGVHGRTSGIKTIKLPHRSNVYDVFRNKAVASGVDEFTFELPRYKTDLFFLGKENPWTEDKE